MSRRVSSIISAAVLLAVFSEPANSQSQPKGLDDTSSMGVFRIVVEPKFVPYFDCLLGPLSPYWESSTRKLTSPVLVDDHTLIQRSVSFAEGSSMEFGVPCGDDGTGSDSAVPDVVIRDMDMVLVPTGFDALTPEVHTNVYSMNLSVSRCGFTPVCSGASIPLAIRAGVGLGLPKCPGEVASNAGSPFFPASSFFNMFVEVEIGTTPPIIFYNKPLSPLLIANNSVDMFPPRVIYKHENSLAVGVHLKTGGTSSCGSVAWMADEFFGWLTLAGHGVSMLCEPDSMTMTCEEFYDAVVTKGTETAAPDPDALSAVQLTSVFPNPAGTAVTFRFDLRRPTVTQLRVFDSSGRLVRAQSTGTWSPGVRDVVWDGRDTLGKKVAPGIYFYRIQAGAYKAEGKFTIVR